jgi:hypothetical protein
MRKSHKAQVSVKICVTSWNHWGVFVRIMYTRSMRKSHKAHVRVKICVNSLNHWGVLGVPSWDVSMTGVLKNGGLMITGCLHEPPPPPPISLSSPPNSKPSIPHLNARYLIVYHKL